MSHKRNSGYVEGYVDGGNRDIKPFDPNSYPVTEIIVTAPGGSNLIHTQNIVTVNTTAADGDLITSESFLFVPVVDSNMFMTVNGVSVFPANGISEQAISTFYITDSTGDIIRTKGTYEIGDLFHWNGSIALYELDSSDVIKLIYQL